jgi:peptidase S41-like protein
MRLMLAIALAVILAPVGVAQSPAGQADTTIDGAMRSRVIAQVLRRLDEGYVFPGKAAEMRRTIGERAKQGAYDRIVSARAFADTLTQDLRRVSHDLHLEVVYQSRRVQDEVPDAEPSAEVHRERAALARRINYGLERVERLSGNVGYLEIRSFDIDAGAVDSVLAAAMNFLANTDALIIDVRRNGGGDPLRVAAVCSYLLPPSRLVNKFYWRQQNRWDEFRTGPVTGRHYGTARPVYVLTSDQTFSGAEEFAYDVQTQRRGEVVGDTTGGGAHPGGLRSVTEHFGVWVPSGRAVNPVTGTNWEGTGVLPDVPVEAAAALRTAHLRALERLLKDERDIEHRARLQRAIDEAQRAPTTS